MKKILMLAVLPVMFATYEANALDLVSMAQKAQEQADAAEAKAEAKKAEAAAKKPRAEPRLKNQKMR